MAMTPMAVAHSAPPLIPHAVMSTPYYPYREPPYTAPGFYPKAVPMPQRVPPPMILSHPGFYENRDCCDCTDGCCLCTCLTALCCAQCFCEDEACICCY